MLVEIDKETVDFICKHKLTFNQLAICLFILKKDVTSIIKIKNEVCYIGDCLIPTEDKEYKQELDDLIHRKFLIRKIHDKHEPYAFDNFTLNTNFAKEFRTPQELGEEFFSHYPKLGIINGTEYSAKACDFDDMVDKYYKSIKGSIRKHERIIELLKENGDRYATMNIMKYIGGRVWETDELSTKVKTRGI